MVDKKWLQECAEAVKARLPDNHGFIVLASNFENNPDSRLFYTSNIKRENAIALLKEFIKASGEEEWMKHLK